MSKPSNPYRRPDAFTKAAKAKGYPARSVFKLEEIDRRVRLLRPGQRVLDLGAAPGSWSLYAAQRIGPGGQLLAVDLQPITVPLGAGARFSQGDALSLANEDLALFAPYDVVLSDMAPSTTGSKLADQARSFELFMRALAVAEALGVRPRPGAPALQPPGGAFVGKLFMSDDFTAARDALRALFDEVKTIRPEGTRSRELRGVPRRTPAQIVEMDASARALTRDAWGPAPGVVAGTGTRDRTAIVSFKGSCPALGRSPRTTESDDGGGREPPIGFEPIHSCLQGRGLSTSSGGERRKPGESNTMP